jgi:hypothetical protein
MTLYLLHAVGLISGRKGMHLNSGKRADSTITGPCTDLQSTDIFSGSTTIDTRSSGDELALADHDRTRDAKDHKQGDRTEKFYDPSKKVEIKAMHMHGKVGQAMGTESSAHLTWTLSPASVLSSH